MKLEVFGQNVANLLQIWEINGYYNGPQSVGGETSVPGSSVSQIEYLLGRVDCPEVTSVFEKAGSKMRGGWYVGRAEGPERRSNNGRRVRGPA